MKTAARAEKVRQDGEDKVESGLRRHVGRSMSSWLVPEGMQTRERLKA